MLFKDLDIFLFLLFKIKLCEIIFLYGDILFIVIVVVKFELN